jgi:broad specificity phosphatase PhoE
MHNINAEIIRDAGCSYEEFLDQMRKDDVFDAPLTTSGKEQARAAANIHKHLSIDTVISSPLSRAVDTADLVCPHPATRIIREEWREISGGMLNAKRLGQSQLKNKYPTWETSHLPSEDDTLWTPTLETRTSTISRAYSGLLFILSLPASSSNILIAAHGGIFSVLFNDKHPNIVVEDESMKRRFGNCDLRSCQVALDGETIIITK